jgi:hypothetical protein
MMNDLQIELSIVEAYVREVETRRAQQLHWIADILWEAFHVD